MKTTRNKNTPTKVGVFCLLCGELLPSAAVLRCFLLTVVSADSQTYSVSQSGHFLETASLHLPQAALRRFPPAGDFLPSAAKSYQKTPLRTYGSKDSLSRIGAKDTESIYLAWCRILQSKSKSGITPASNPLSRLLLQNIEDCTPTVPPSAAAISCKCGHICHNE